MKQTLLLITWISLSAGATCKGGQARFLAPGETVTYAFEFLQHAGPFGDTVPTPAQGQFQFSPVFAPDPDSAMRVELFESSAADSLFFGGPPIFTGLWTPESGPIDAALPDAWQDRQGAVRFTGVRGTTGFENFDIRVLTPVDTFHYDVFSRTFSAAPRPESPPVLVDFNRYFTDQDNDLANNFIRYNGISQVAGLGIAGGAAAGSLAEITTYGFAAFAGYGLRNLPGDTCEVSAFFKFTSSPRPSWGAAFKLFFAYSTNAFSDAIEARFASGGGADSLTLPTGFLWGSVTNTNWFRLTLHTLNQGESNRFTLTVSLQDYGVDGLAAVGPILTSVWEVNNARLAASAILYGGFYVEGVRFGRAVVDNFSLRGTAFTPPRLVALRSDRALNLSWDFPGTNFNLEAAAGWGSSALWEAVTETVTHNGDRHTVQVPFDQPARFFRLRSR